MALESTCYKQAAWLLVMSSHITRLLVAWGEGDQHARDELLDAVYDDLRRLAHHHLRHERPGHTLQTTAIVHDAYLQLVDQRYVRWQNRTHFFAIASHLIRRILVAHARRRSADKRGGGAIRVALHPEMAASKPRDIALVAMDRALEALEQVDPQQSRIVELRFFGGLTVEETAEVLGISSRTVKRDWRMAKAWLQRALETEEAT
jgi:RNA polymerase sigma factor (TIGR02999 family)